MAKTLKGYGKPPVESRGSEGTPLLSKLLLRVQKLSSPAEAGSTLSPRLGQEFMARGITCAESILYIP